MYPQLIRRIVEEEALPDSYAVDAETWFLPLIDSIAARCNETSETLLIGINGAQGTGKSTLARLMASLLGARDLQVASLSIDDFYYSRQRRRKLAEAVHPLLASRGVPGTHDTGLILEKLQELKSVSAGQEVRLPAFDKATDDSVAVEQWPAVRGPVDLVVLEGWFVGARPQTEEELEEAVNPLERREDSEGRWRNYVNQRLARDYQPIFRQLDTLIMLQAPSFHIVFEWRRLQEEKLRARHKGGSAGLMDDEALRRFIQHFERLTRHCLQTLPAQADIVFRLDDSHRVVGRQG